LVATISESVGRLSVQFEQEQNLKLRRVNRMRTIQGSLAIEGNTLGIEKVTAILEGKRVLGSLREISEVKGAIKVYDNLSHFDYKNLDDLLLAHKMLMQEILTHAGNFRLSNVGVGDEKGVVHVAPPYGRVADLMQDLFSWLATSDIHPLIKSSVFHYEFEFIHPFIDGNGRMGRLWQSLILYEWKPLFSAIPIESVIKETQQAYYDALEAAGNKGESTPFIEFMLKAILKTCEDELKNQQNDPINVPKNVPIKRLDRILSLITENNSITIEQLAQYCDVSEKTIKRDISKLKAQGVLVREGSLKSGSWRVGLRYR
jgi:Fic family protein